MAEKYICIMSHKVPLDDKGRFLTFEAGREYEVEDPEPGHFRPVHGTPEGENTSTTKHTKSRRKAGP